MIGLTQTQQKTLDFIRSEAALGRTPSYEEICRHLGIGSKAGVHRIIKALTERGRIRRIPNRARALEVLDRASAPPADLNNVSTDELLAELQRRQRHLIRREVAA